MMLAAQGINIVINVDVSIWNFGYAIKWAHTVTKHARGPHLVYFQNFGYSVFRFQTINYYTESNQLRSFFCLFLAYVCVCTPKPPNNIQIFWLTLVKGIIHVRYTRGIHRHTQEKTFTNNLVQQQTLSLEIFLTKSASAYASVCIFCGMRET